VRKKTKPLAAREADCKMYAAADAVTFQRNAV